jgi:hypothetical protein
MVRKSASEALERLQAKRKEAGGLLSYHRPPLPANDAAKNRAAEVADSNSSGQIPR